MTDFERHPSYTRYDGVEVTFMPPVRSRDISEYPPEWQKSLLASRELVRILQLEIIKVNGEQE